MIVANTKTTPGLLILINKGKKIIDPNNAPNPCNEIIKENCSGVALYINLAKYGVIDSNVNAVKFPIAIINKVAKIILFLNAKFIPLLKPEYLFFFRF